MDLIKKPLHQRFSKKKQFLFFAIPLILATLFQWFFFDHELGINYSLFIISLFIGYLSLFWDRLQKQSIAGWITMSASIILSFVYLFFQATPIIAINFFVIPLLALTSGFLLTGWNESKWSDLSFLWEFFPKALVKLLEHIPTPVRSFITILQGRKESSARKQIVTGLLIAAPLLVILIALLSSADAIFESYLTSFTDLITIEIADELIGRIAILFIAFWGLATFAWMIASFQYNGKPKQTEYKRSLSSITSITIISLVVLLYFVFLAIQFRYLFLGADLSFLDNMTYAEYARRGFGELVAITMINLSLVLGFSVFSKRESVNLTLIRKALSATLVIFTIILLYSSHIRLGLYEQAYGFTYTRVLVHCFMIFLGFALIASLIKTIKEDFPFLQSALTIGLAGWIIISFMNIDSMIVNKNIERFEEHQRIDMNYLVYNLSSDALPAILSFAETQHYPVQVIKQDVTTHSPATSGFYTKIALCQEENDCYNLDTFQRRELLTLSWQEFNFSKHWKQNFIKDQIAQSEKE